MEIANDNKRKTVKESDVLKALEGSYQIKWGAFCRWSFGLDSACGSIETMPLFRLTVYYHSHPTALLAPFAVSPWCGVTSSSKQNIHSEADFDEMIPLIEKELEEVKNKKKQNKKPKNEEANNEEMEA